MRELQIAMEEEKRVSPLKRVVSWQNLGACFILKNATIERRLDVAAERRMMR